MKKGTPYKKRLQKISKIIMMYIRDIAEKRYEPLLSHFYDVKILEFDGDLIIINKHEFDQHQQPKFNNKELRLLKDIILQQYPVYKNMPDIVADVTEKELGLLIPKHRFEQIKPFKKILMKQQIFYDMDTNKPYIKDKLRFRNKSAKVDKI